ncbi:MAG: UDP-glucose 6-dehydrogenase [Hyphomicrobiales bacterium]|nr:MAG: UDP-glucose 6-dehydrogenase [Hyphomicrobiales bacterium]
MRIIVVGCGYVGLVSGACFAELGNDVVCVDTNPARIAALNGGDCPIYEPGLERLIACNRQAGRLAFAEALPFLGNDVDLVMIAVGTPPARTGGADLSSVFAVAEAIAARAHERVVVVTKSTVPAGTGDAIERLIAAARPDLDLSVASNPEFLREGSALADFLRPDRVVIGTQDARARNALMRLYRPLTDAGVPLLSTTRTAAEITKYAANAFLALKITFINEIADLCEAAAADVRDVARGIGLDRRIGEDFLRAGPGYGGSCFPKDTSALAATARELGMSLRLVEEAILVNEERKYAMGHRVIDAMGGDVGGKTVAVLGLTFKPDTDDMRDSPALALISVLQQAGAFVRVYDPQGMDNAAEFLAGVAFARDGYDCVAGAHCAVLATEWAELRQLDLSRIAASLAVPVFVDLRNAFDPAALADAGLMASGIGYPMASLIASRKRLELGRPRKARPAPVPAPAEADGNRLRHPHHATLQ